MDGARREVNRWFEKVRVIGVNARSNDPRRGMRSIRRIQQVGVVIEQRTEYEPGLRVPRQEAV